MGIDSVPRNHPDYFPLLVGNYILGGGGFVSRLMNEIREKRGLAYSVSSYFIPSKYMGFFSASMQTKKDQSQKSVELLNQTIQEFVVKGPSDEEITAAKSNLMNGFALRIDSNSKLLANVAGIAWNELPLDTLDTWTTQVEKVSKEDIQRVFKKYLDSERMVTVVVGGN
jgi:zinc protease